MGKDKLGLKILIILTILEMTAGCATKTAPKVWLVEPEKAQTQAFGFWTTVEYSTDSSLKLAHGELIAINKGKLYLLGYEGLIGIPTEKIHRVKIFLYKSKEQTIEYWALLGTLSTISHGYSLIFSAPVWIISGIICAIGESKSGVLEYPEHSWEEIRKYARFPQGIPEGIDLSSLKLRKY